MTMLANRTETRALTLADYEARIHLYKEQIGVGYIGIGRTLNEAKAAQVVPHGQWEAWVTEATGLTPRQAQRCMKAATEIKDGSAMAQLEMSKALMLLGSGLDADAQEAIAGRAAEEGATVKALKEEIRQALKRAEEDRDGLKHQLEATIKAYQQRMDEEAGAAYRRGLQDKAAGMEQDIRKEFQGKIDYLNGQKRQAEERVKSLQTELAAARNEGSTRWDEGYRAAQNEITGLKNEANKQRQYAEELRRNQDDLLAAAEEAEKRAADAEAELEALRATGPEGKEPAWKVIKMAADRFRMECEMLPILDAPGVLRGEKQIQPCLDWMETWLQVMRDTLAGVVRSEGAVL